MQDLSKRLAVSALFFVLTLVPFANAQQWRPVSGGNQANISGMTVIGHEKRVTSLLVVHDNKKKDQARATILKIAGSDLPLYTPLKWPADDLPTDLEAIASVPGRTGQFIALASAGRAFHIRVDSTAATVEVTKSFDLPMIPKDGDFEGFDLQMIDGSLIAVWAERGATATPATIFWSRFDLESYKFSEVGSASFRVPFPLSDVRHVSDIKVDATGAAFVSAASDPGDDGPFASALYFAGVFRIDDQKRITFRQPAMQTPIYRFDYHKVEAFDLVPGRDGGMIFGTDNESLGTSILLTY